MDGGSAEFVLSRLRYAFDRTHPIIDGLTDDEFFWKPVEPCWSIRRRAEVDQGWGVGEWCCEDVWPPPEPLPVTTIGWRLVHLAAWTDVYRSFAFEDGTETLLAMEVPGTAVDAVAWLERAQDRFLDEVAGINPTAFEEPRPAHWGEAVRLSVLIGLIEFEHTHHGAEISVLRDLHRGSARTLVLPFLSQ